MSYESRRIQSNVAGSQTTGQVIALPQRAPRRFQYTLEVLHLSIKDLNEASWPSQQRQLTSQPHLPYPSPWPSTLQSTTASHPAPSQPLQLKPSSPAPNPSQSAPGTPSSTRDKPFSNKALKSSRQPPTSRFLRYVRKTNARRSRPRWEARTSSFL